LNLRRLAPKASALAKLSYAPALRHDARISHRSNLNLEKNGFANRNANRQNAHSIKSMKKTALTFTLLAVTAFLSGCGGSSSTGSAANSAPPATPTNSVSSSASAAAAPPTDSASDTNLLNSDKARESYALGMYLGQQIKGTGLDLDQDLIERAFKDAISGNPALMSKTEMSAGMTAFTTAARANRQKVMEEEAKTNATAGAAFLEANKSKPGVVTLPDGLQYKVITDGSGEKPSPNDTVSVNYKGTLVDGTEFDSSAKTGHPAEFPVRAVIPGWTEALEKMNVGSKWQLFIPANLAYGPGGRPPVIPPNSTLVFDVELLSISHPQPPPPRQPLTSDIIRVPSAEEMKNGAKVETIKASDVQKMQQQGATNSGSTN
jgi:FKBP-type peptidyl-prolyl cis-trans isomerase